eukprot:NODE_2609_length_339_cov_41.764151_g2599_i0.p1 GENE.NODE_2609_length_339_cov_41.764151_g2599_i0~~NODE_2609_length_339_cov_41.764151_g2599_i0.p1  ORF type:complete len:70 (-),score=23.05 NODE_2609_length_339_cov_41.764151_g2599_i0:118-327(-)
MYVIYPQFFFFFFFFFCGLALCSSYNAKKQHIIQRMATSCTMLRQVVVLPKAPFPHSFLLAERNNLHHL